MARHETGVDTILFVIPYQADLAQARSTDQISIEEAYQGRLSNQPAQAQEPGANQVPQGAPPVPPAVIR